MAQFSNWNVDIQSNLDGVEDIWRALYSAHPPAVFQNFSLQEFLFHALRQSKVAEPFVALVYTNKGDLAAIFPFTKFKQGRLTWIASADHGMLDTCQPILSPDLVNSSNISSLIRAVQKALPAADVVYFNKLPATINGQDNIMLGLAHVVLLPMSKWPIDLSKGYEQHKKDKTSGNFRSWIKRRIKKTEKDFARNFEFFIGDEVTAEVYGRVEEMRATYFERDGRKNHLEDPNWSNFYRRLAIDAKGSLKSWVCFLSLDDQPAAAILGLTEYDYAVGLIVATNTRDFADYSPGAQLTEKVMQLFELRGVQVFDWSIGDWDYKRRFGAEQIRLYDFMMPKSFAGYVYYLFWRVKSLLRNTRFREHFIKIRTLLTKH